MIRLTVTSYGFFNQNKKFQESIQSVRFSPDGSVIIIGLTNGKWCVFDATRREILSTYQDGNEPIQDVKFSPDNSSLALGSRDNTIYIYQALKDFTTYHKIGRCVVSTKYPPSKFLKGSTFFFT